MNKIITGDTAVFTFSILYEGAVADKPAPDLSDCDVVFAIKKNINDTKTVVKKTISAPATHVLSFELTASETASLKEGVYSACCKLYRTGGEEITAWMGNITVIKGVLGADR